MDLDQVPARDLWPRDEHEWRGAHHVIVPTRRGGFDVAAGQDAWLVNALPEPRDYDPNGHHDVRQLQRRRYAGAWSRLHHSRRGQA